MPHYCPIVLIESLEDRRLLAAVAPTPLEQYMIELVNRARANPADEAALLGIDLNEGLASGTITADPKQPLAINPFLTDAARQHSQWMLNNNTFGHTGAGGSSPGDRMSAAGYTFVTPWQWGENLAWRGQTRFDPEPVSTTAQMHDDLFIDEGIPDRGHRTLMLDPDFKEIGVGVVAGSFNEAGTIYRSLMATQAFAFSGTGVFLTGVVYQDTVTDDDFYTPGEGLGGVTIQAVRLSDMQTFTTTTFASGGYSLKLPAGTYRVTASGGGLPASVGYQSVVIGSENVKRDFTPESERVDPLPPTIGVRIGDGVAGERNVDSGTFVFTRTGNTAAALTVTFNLSGSAIGGLDYQPVDQQVTFAPGQSTVEVRITPIDDALPESDETVVLTLTQQSGYMLDNDNTSATLTLVDNDRQPLMTTRTVLAGADAGSPPTVRGFENNGALMFSFDAYGRGWRGGVRVATGDVNGDGTPDIITGPGQGAAAHIRVIDGATGQVLASPLGNFFAYDIGYLGGVYVAAGDVNGDGRADIVTGTQAGPPHVKVFSGADGSLLASFYAYDPAFLGGVRVAAGDIDGDGRAEVLTAAGPGAGPHVKVFTGVGGVERFGFFAYASTFSGGVFISAGDLNGDGRDEIITGAGTVPHVVAFNAATRAPVASFFAYDPGFRGGVRVGSADINNDGRDEIITVSGPGVRAHARTWSAAGALAAIDSFFAEDFDTRAGMFVA